MNLVLPAALEDRDLRFTSASQEEMEADLDFARAVGCLIMRSDPDDLMNGHHLAIDPSGAGLTLWWAGRVDITKDRDTKESAERGVEEPEDEVMVPYKISRIEGLEYAGLWRRPDSPLSFIRPRQFERNASLGNISVGDQVAFLDSDGNLRKTYPIHTIEEPIS